VLLASISGVEQLRVWAEGIPLWCCTGQVLRCMTRLPAIGSRRTTSARELMDVQTPRLKQASIGLEIFQMIAREGDVKKAREA
tara:strand:+ start:1244 stop:1492 length:249 start_codon:yes stop_codon:yes gene_type:complete